MLRIVYCKRLFFPEGYEQLLRIRNPPATLRDIKWVHSYEDKANVFANYFVDIFQSHNTIFLPGKINEVEEFFTLHFKCLSPKQFSPAEIQCTIFKFPWKKYDLITSEIVNPKKVIILLTYIFNDA